MKRLIYIVLICLPVVGFSQGFLLNPYRFQAYDPDYQAVLDRATTLGYTLPSASVQVKQNTLVADLKTAGIWSGLDVFYVFANDGGAEFATLNWKAPSTFQATLVNSPTFSLKGFTGNGTSSYIESNFNPAVSGVNMSLNANSFGFWLDSLDTAPGATEGHWCNNTAVSAGSFWLRYTAGRAYANQSIFLTLSAGAIVSKALLHANRSGASAIQYYRAGALLNSSTSASVAFLSNTFKGLLSNTAYSNATLSVAFAGGNLSTQAAAFQTSVSNYMNSL